MLDKCGDIVYNIDSKIENDGRAKELALLSSCEGGLITCTTDKTAPSLHIIPILK